MSPMGWFKEMVYEWRARRAGRRFLDHDIRTATRDVTGPLGWVMTSTWDQLDQKGDAYIKSFDRRLPPSLHVSERDRTRANMPIPPVERCIEDWNTEQAEEAKDDVAEGVRPIDPPSVGQADRG